LRAENQALTDKMNLMMKDIHLLEKSMGALAADDERLRYYHEMEPLSAQMRQGGIGGRYWQGNESGGVADSPQGNVQALPPSKRLTLEKLSFAIDQLQMEAKLQEESFKQIERKFLDSEEDLSHFPTILPVPAEGTWVSSNFGVRRDPFTGRMAHHSGIDFAGRPGMPIYATGDGLVVYAYKDIRLGNVIVIEHNIEVTDDNGERQIRKGKYRTEYGHLKRIMVKKGDRVVRRQQIGTLGNTGRSTGPHLHYAVRYTNSRMGGYGGYVDPRDFILDMPGHKIVLGWQR
jgi:murein DD-endopeptidase MepM/ murein hydrolase activator NlpD